MDPHLSGYCSLERIVLIPAYKNEQYGPAIDDPESLVVCPVSMADAELGAVVIRLLRDQRYIDWDWDYRGDDYKPRLAQRRRLLCKAFGVRAAKDWLTGSTYVSIVATGGNITATPCRRDGERDAWSAQKDDPVVTAPLSGPAEVGAALRSMLALQLPPNH